MPPDMTPPEGSFSVKGAEHADQISIDVLRTVCVAARHFGASLLWLDRLCIMQCRKDDKSWQIQRMHQIYTCCNPCLVLPGGLVRLAKLSEPTTWIDRAWTLQEAIAPGRNKLKCLFSFTQTTYKAFIQEECADSFSPAFLNFMDHTPSPLQTIIEPERSAACDLLELFRLMAGGMAGFKCHEPSLSSRHDRFPVGIIHTPAAKLLQRVLKSRSSQHLWMSAYTRSSSRPADMVFSIMGIMGVNLEVSQFDVQDRTKATIKLIQELMKRGQSARWLYISPTMPTSREISTLPQMPETSESGRAFLRTGDEMTPAFEAIGEQEIWQSDGAPDGVMFDSGYFRFYGKAALVVQKSGTSSKSWGERALTRVYDDREVWAVVVGSRKELNRDPKTGKIRGTPAGAPPPLGITEITLMFIERHSYGLFHRVGMEREINEKNTTEWSWTYREFDVGGPGRGERVRFQIAPTGPVYM